MLGQRALNVSRLGLDLRLRLGRGGGRWRLDECATRTRLGDRRRNGLYTLAGGYRDTTSNNCGGGDTKPGPGDEVASGDDRPGVLLS